MKDILGMFKVRKAVLAFTDMLIIATATFMAYFVTPFYGDKVNHKAAVVYLVFSVVTCLGALSAFGAYNKMWRYFSRNDYISCIGGVFGGIVLAYGLCKLSDRHIPAGTVAMQLFATLFAVSAFRFIFKDVFIPKEDEVKCGPKAKRTMIIGGGKAGESLIEEILASHKHRKLGAKISSEFRPVCIIDDDTKKVGTTFLGIPVVGTTAQISNFVDEMNIEQIIFAIPTCSEKDKRRILEVCSSTSLPIKVLPFIGNLFLESNELMGSVKDISIEDLLGREPIKFGNKQVKHSIAGKVCMVTGGGGSIGSELVRQIAKYNPAKIIIVDIYENNAYEIQQELLMEYKGINLITLIASVRDYYRMNQIFEEHRPNIVFHAAAHKHVPLMESSPMEAIKNNVIGTFNVASLAKYHKIEKFVMISTDKAVNPTNVMGASKRCCEMIVQYMSQYEPEITEFVTTRFGNVLGSNGSVIPLFKRQIEQGKPVTVTHKDVIRYFMTIPEAVSLVLEASAMARGGEIFVLDMGEPVRIITLAENLIRMYGKTPYKDVKIQFTGLRPGEKIKEELLMLEEGLEKTANELIYIGNQIEIDEKAFIEQLSILKEAAHANKADVVVAALHEIVPTFVSPEEFNKSVLTV